MANQYVIDVSGYQGNVDWGYLKNNGIVGGIIKIIKKDLSKDSQFMNNYTGLKKNSMPWGVYNYSYATTVQKARSDMNLVCDILDACDTSKLDYGVWFDTEDKVQAVLSKSVLTDIINAAQDVVESRGYKFGVYTGMSFYRENIDSSRIKCKNWWISRYYNDSHIYKLKEAPNEAYKPSVIGDIVAWQFTQKCKTKSGLVDMNVLYRVPTTKKETEVNKVSGAIDKLIKIASAEVGYLEKKSNKNLDDKTANAGSGNWTKYARDLQKWTGQNKIYPNAAPWCDMFVDHCLIRAFGVDNAKKMIGGWSAYTPTSAQYYKNMKRWHSTPKAGDQIFFKNASRICHTGLVYKVENGKVYTIEGNTSGASGVIANGGGVCKKSYALNYSRIAGYGRPNYDLVQTAQNNAGAKKTAAPKATPATNKKSSAAASSKPKTKTGVTTARLNVRLGPGTSYGLCKTWGPLAKGTRVTIVKTMSNGWHLIEYKGKRGYCSGKYIK